jgi:hypothetical protein
VIRKNNDLVATLPKFIASDELKQNFLKMRKNLMVREIHSEIRCKRDSEWKTTNIYKHVLYHQMIEQGQRPTSVINVLRNMQ